MCKILCDIFGNKQMAWVSENFKCICGDGINQFYCVEMEDNKRQRNLLAKYSAIGFLGLVEKRAPQIIPNMRWHTYSTKNAIAKWRNEHKTSMKIKESSEVNFIWCKNSNNFHDDLATNKIL